MRFFFFFFFLFFLRLKKKKNKTQFSDLGFFQSSLIFERFGSLWRGCWGIYLFWLACSHSLVFHEHVYLGSTTGGGQMSNTITRDQWSNFVLNYANVPGYKDTKSRKKYVWDETTYRVRESALTKESVWFYTHPPMEIFFSLQI